MAASCLSQCWVPVTSCRGSAQAGQLARHPHSLAQLLQSGSSRELPGSRLQPFSGKDCHRSLQEAPAQDGSCPAPCAPGSSLSVPVI